MPSATESRPRSGSDGVPILLEAFPLPPSFIPPSPLFSNAHSTPASPTNFPSKRSSHSSVLSSPNPNLSPKPAPLSSPLSSPPSGPLPPVPGPSPITEHETLLFMSATRAARRASKMSLASSVSSYSYVSHARDRDSVLSVPDVASIPSLSPSGSSTSAASTGARSLRSYSSSSSLSVPAAYARERERSPRAEPRIAEADEEAQDLTRLSLADMNIHLSDEEDVEKVLDLGVVVGVPPSYRYARIYSDDDAYVGMDPDASLAAVDMSEVPPLRDEDLEPEPPRAQVRRSIRHSADKTLPPLPPAPSGRLPSPPCTPGKARPSSELQDVTPRRTGNESPDITDIIARTPRPRRKSSSHGIGPSLSRSRSRPRNSTRSAPVSRRTSATSSGGLLPNVRTRRDSSASGSERVQRWGVDATGTPYELREGAPEEMRLDRVLDGAGSDADSDSSLDLHTPLPQLMVRDGLLSPNSKLVAREDIAGRPGSRFSVASSTGSVMTKSGLFKDSRDTQARRVRHRDGRMLRGGIGLTTGLGWSDSEDEDAPAPLVHQLSSGALRPGKRVSAASTMGARSVRSVGSMRSLRGTDEFGVLKKTSETYVFPAPPNAGASWPRPRIPGLEKRTSTSSSLSSASSRSALSRKSGHTAGLTSPPSRYAGLGRGLGHIREGEGEEGERASGMERTPPSSTSSSTVSLVTPVTPADAATGAQQKKGTDDAALRSVYHSTGALTPATRTLNVPRPLRLPQAHAQTQTLRAPASSPDLSHINQSPTQSQNGRHATSSNPSQSQNLTLGPGLAQSQSLRRVPSQMLPRATTPRRAATLASAPASASTPGTSAQAGVPFPAQSPTKTGAGAGAGQRLRPRTGTGMVYRSTPPTTPTTPSPSPAAHAFSAAGSTLASGSPGGRAPASLSMHVPGPSSLGGRAPASLSTSLSTPAAHAHTPRQVQAHPRPSMLRMPSSASLRSAKGIGVAI